MWNLAEATQKIKSPSCFLKFRVFCFKGKLIFLLFVNTTVVLMMTLFLSFVSCIDGILSCTIPKTYHKAYTTQAYKGVIWQKL